MGDNSLLQSASEADEGISIENQFGEVNECTDDDVEVLRKELQLLRMNENRYYRKMIKLEGAMEGLLEDNKELSLAVRQLMHENIWVRLGSFTLKILRTIKETFRTCNMNIDILGQ